MAKGKQCFTFDVTIGNKVKEATRPPNANDRIFEDELSEYNAEVKKAMASKLVLQRRLLRFLQLLAPSSSSSTHMVPFLSKSSLLPSRTSYSRNLCSGSFNLDESQAPLTVDYRSLLDESEFHRLADSTIHSVQEKLEDYGDLVEVDGFDIDYGNDVLTVKLGDLGTYVLNKQTPNRQLWLSSPMRSVVRQGLIGIGISRLGFIDGTKQTCIKSWKVSWSSYVAKLSFFPKLLKSLLIGRIIVALGIVVSYPTILASSFGGLRNTRPAS
ncbi:hypothetical protein V8G54_035692 [Vigna mungo]|uniref:Ferroxidase n=1 Tax=Vigna mungo TaxID=3915 RepID=A0AAQ3REN6_VIGMU